MTNNTASLYRKNLNRSDIVLKGLIYLSVVITLVTLMGILLYILVKGVPHISWKLISTPYSEINENMRGILPMIINTLYIVIITIFISAPIGISSAIYLQKCCFNGNKLANIASNA